MHGYVFQGYWEDIGTIRSFFEANLDLTADLPRFNFFDMSAPIFTRPRFLPASKINGAEISHASVSDGCIINRCHVNHSIVGIRSLIEEGCDINRAILLGCDFYESESSIKQYEARGLPRIGVGKNTKIENAIVDKNARIGENCRISPAGKPESVDHPLYYMRDGIVIIPKGGLIPHGTGDLSTLASVCLRSRIYFPPARCYNGRVLNDALIWKSLKHAGPLILIAGPCVIENERLCFQVASSLRATCRKLGINYIFKASYDKANRSSAASPFAVRGWRPAWPSWPKFAAQLGVPVLTDVHTEEQARAAAAVVDILQIPAFLCRQTDFIAAAVAHRQNCQCEKGPVPFPAGNGPGRQEGRRAPAEKNCCSPSAAPPSATTTWSWTCAPSPSCAQFGFPVIFDATHSVQLPGAGGDRSGGQREFAPVLARCAVAAGADGLFIETHPDPDHALSDGPNMIPLAPNGPASRRAGQNPRRHLLTHWPHAHHRKCHAWLLAGSVAPWPRLPPSWAQPPAPQLRTPAAPPSFLIHTRHAAGKVRPHATVHGHRPVANGSGSPAAPCRSRFKMIGVRDGQITKSWSPPWPRNAALTSQQQSPERSGPHPNLHPHHQSVRPGRRIFLRGIQPVAHHLQSGRDPRGQVHAPLLPVLRRRRPTRPRTPARS